MSTLLKIEEVYARRDDPVPEAQADPPDAMRCQFGMRGVAAGRCPNRPAFVFRGAAICNDCVIELNKRFGADDIVLHPLETIHG